MTETFTCTIQFVDNAIAKLYCIAQAISVAFDLLLSRETFVHTMILR